MSPKIMLKELYYREYGLKPFVKSNYKIYRGLIIENLSKYVCVWQKQSFKPIHYECGRLFENNFRHCFRVPFKRVKRLPKVYKLDTSFEDGICCTTQLVDIEEVDCIKQAWSFIGITKQNNYLIQIKWSNGELMHKIHLSNIIPFRHISWETEGETLVAKSRLNQKNQHTSSSEWYLCAFAFFGVFPFRFLGAMKVKASDFGEDIDNAYVMDHILFISFKRRCVRLYSLTDVFTILNSRSNSSDDPSDNFQFNINFSSNDVENSKLDQLFPKLTCLTEINCHRSNLMIGGFPWSSITELEDGFKVSILNSPVSTTITQSNNSIEEDNVLFHSNGSNRLIHQTTTKFSVLKPKYNFEDRSLNLINLYEINSTIHSLNKAPEVVQVTKSGRKVRSTRKEGNAEIDTRLVLAFAYEHNMELIGVLFTSNTKGGELKLYDDISGQYLSSVHFVYGFWNEDTQHVIDIDMDVIYHMSRSSNIVRVAVYRFIK